MNLTGRFIVWRTATTTPPLAVPSSLVKITPVQPIALGEDFGLADRILAVGRVNDQQNFVRRAGDEPLDNIADLLKLAHQVGLSVKPARGVDDQDVDIAG